MFCPKCATQNVEGASFCRACGVNIGLVPQALTGQLPTAVGSEYSVRDWRKLRRKRPPTIDEAVRHLMMGIAFVIVSILIGKYSPGGWTWWYWMLIPAFTFLGRGISDLIRLNQARGELTPPQISQTPMSSATPVQSFPARGTNELLPPVPSVTEGTTRHLGAEAPTRHFDSVTGEEKIH
jgi:hypothetical protein